MHHQFLDFQYFAFCDAPNHPLEAVQVRNNPHEPSWIEMLDDFPQGIAAIAGLHAIAP
jgi:hypothetical protein